MNPNQWAAALDIYWRDLAAHEGSPVLTLEGSTLLEVAQGQGCSFSKEQEAERSFCEAVESFQSGLVRPWRTGDHQEDPPRFLLLIGIQIYAASRMAEDPDGQYTQRAYYEQLRRVVSRRAMGANFAAEHGDDHQVLWRTHLANWAALFGLDLHLPPNVSGAGRHVRLPMSQAVFRQAEIERLPRFFSACGYRPGMEESTERIRLQLERWRSDPKVFPTRWGRKVARDPHKVDTVCRQIAAVLDRWDGSWEASIKGRTRERRRTSATNVWLAVDRRRRQLRVQSGESFVSARRLSQSAFLEVLSEASRNQVAHRPIEPGLWLFRYDLDDLAYRGVDLMEAGDQVLLLIDRREPPAENAARHLLQQSQLVRELCGYAPEGGKTVGNLATITLDGIPDEFAALALEVADPLPSFDGVPERWHKCLRSPRPALTPQGGLRIGREQAWIRGAGPAIRVSGSPLPTTLMVNGQARRIAGRLFVDERLSRAGVHRVEGRIGGQDVSCVVRVRPPSNESSVEPPSVGWCFGRSWPVWSGVDTGHPCVQGVRVTGTPNELLRSDETDRQAAIRLLLGCGAEVRLRPGLERSRGSQNAKHPLTEALLRNSHGMVREGLVK